jgi:NTP pyrophosphatase (non-canonical NTP hydrolase)
MDWNEYQEWACEGILDTSMVPGYPLLYPALGVAGEAGEYVDKVKKTVRDGITDEKIEDMALELGDILWYVAVSAHMLGYTFEEIIAMNVDKLNSRRERNVVQGDGDAR